MIVGVLHEGSRILTNTCTWIYCALFYRLALQNFSIVIRYEPGYNLYTRVVLKLFQYLYFWNSPERDIHSLVRSR